MREGKPEDRGQGGASVLGALEFDCLSLECFHISSSTLYGVTNLVTEVTDPVTPEESLTMGEAEGWRPEAGGRSKAGNPNCEERNRETEKVKREMLSPELVTAKT